MFAGRKKLTGKKVGRKKSWTFGSNVQLVQLFFTSNFIRYTVFRFVRISANLIWSNSHLSDSHFSEFAFHRLLIWANSHFIEREFDNENSRRRDSLMCPRFMFWVESTTPSMVTNTCTGVDADLNQPEGRNFKIFKQNSLTIVSLLATSRFPPRKK